MPTCPCCPANSQQRPMAMLSSRIVEGRSCGGQVLRTEVAGLSGVNVGDVKAIKTIAPSPPAAKFLEVNCTFSSISTRLSTEEIRDWRTSSGEGVEGMMLGLPRTEAFGFTKQIMRRGCFAQCSERSSKVTQDIQAITTAQPKALKTCFQEGYTI